MKINLGHKDLVTLINGLDIPMGGINEVLTPFVGNQYNPEWIWSHIELNKMTEKKLWSFYQGYDDLIKTLDADPPKSIGDCKPMPVKQLKNIIANAQIKAIESCI